MTDYPILDEADLGEEYYYSDDSESKYPILDSSESKYPILDSSEDKYPVLEETPTFSDWNLAAQAIAGPLAAGAVRGLATPADLAIMGYNALVPEKYETEFEVGRPVAEMLYSPEQQALVKERVPTALRIPGEMAGGAEEFITGGLGVTKLFSQLGKLKKLSALGKLADYGNRAQKVDLATGAAAELAEEIGGDALKAGVALTPTGLGVLRAGGRAVASGGKMAAAGIGKRFFTGGDPDVISLYTDDVADIAKRKIREASALPFLSGDQVEAAGKYKLLQKTSELLPETAYNVSGLPEAETQAILSSMSGVTKPIDVAKRGSSAQDILEEFRKASEADVRATFDMVDVSEKIPLDQDVKKTFKTIGNTLSKRLSSRVGANHELKDARKILGTWSGKKKKSITIGDLKDFHESLVQAKTKLPDSEAKILDDVLGELDNVVEEVDPNLQVAWNDYRRHMELFGNPKTSIVSKLLESSRGLDDPLLGGEEAARLIRKSKAEDFDELSSVLGADGAKTIYQDLFSRSLSDQIESAAVQAPRGQASKSLKRVYKNFVENKQLLSRVYGEKEYNKLLRQFKGLSTLTEARRLAKDLKVSAFQPIENVEANILNSMRFKASNQQLPFYMYVLPSKFFTMPFQGKERAVNEAIYNTLAGRHNLPQLPQKTPAASIAEILRTPVRQGATYLTGE